jgi:tetratricopeptide (TPR) repeat protein
VNASALLFGGISDKKAEAMLTGMNANFEKGDCAAVSEIYQALFSEKPSSAIREKAYAYLGRCYEAQGLPDKAMTIYKLANGLYPESDFFSSRLASIYLKTGFYSAAIPLFEKVLKGRSDDIEANAGMARCYASLGFLSKAKIYYSISAILGNFGDPALLKEYAAQMLRKRDWEEAALILDYALKLAPSDADLYEALARVAAGMGDYKKAAKHMRTAVKLKPGAEEFSLELALMELLGGNCEAALAALPATGTEHAALSLVIRGMALQKKGQRARAMEYFKEASSSNRPFIAPFAAALMNSVQITGK